MIWDIDHLEVGDEQLVDIARDYGFGGETPEAAARLLRRWGYRVRKRRLPTRYSHTRPKRTKKSQN